MRNDCASELGRYFVSPAVDTIARVQFFERVDELLLELRFRQSQNVRDDFAMPFLRLMFQGCVVERLFQLDFSEKVRLGIRDGFEEKCDLVLADDHSAFRVRAIAGGIAWMLKRQPDVIRLLGRSLYGSLEPVIFNFSAGENLICMVDVQPAPG